MRQIDLFIPKDALRALLEDKQASVPYTVTGEGEPVRIVIWARQAEAPVKKFGGAV